MSSKSLSPAAILSRTKFAQAMLLGMNSFQAAVHIGLRGQEGTRIVREPLVERLLEEGRKKLEKKFEYTRDKAVKLLYEAIDMSRILEDPTSVIRAVQELNKMHGFLAPEIHEIRLSEDLSKRQRQIKELPDEQLLELAAIEGTCEKVEE